MKKIFALCVFLTLVMIAMPASAETDIRLDYVEAEDITDTDLGWGLKVSEHPGNYGGMNADPIWDGRLVSDTVDNGGDGDTSAYYTFTWENAAAQTLVIRHLDGIADDSFIVEAYLDPGYGEGDDKNLIGWWVTIGTYCDEGPVETWKTTCFDLIGPGHWAKGTGEMTIKITLTGDLWSGYNTYGQLAIDWMELRGNGYL